MPSVKYSIVIPAYNEEKRILRTLEQTRSFMESLGGPCEIIVVSDGSTDSTESIAERFFRDFPAGKVLRCGAHRGKGSAVRKGMLEARGEWVLFSDADLSTPIDELQKLSEALQNGCDVAIGSRALKGSRILTHQPFYRELMGKTFNKIVKVLLLRGISDTQCGFKLFRKECIAPIFSLQRIDGFCFDVEILYLAKKLGYRTAEVPVTWTNSPLSKVNSLRDPIKMFRDLLKIKFYDLAGRYVLQNVPPGA